MDAGTIIYADIVAVIGETLALRLSKDHGGHDLYIPSLRRLGDNAPVVVLVGRDAAEALARRWGSNTINVPLGPGKRARIWERRADGWTIGRIATEMRCTERTVYATLAGPRPKELGAPAKLPPLLAYLANR